MAKKESSSRFNVVSVVSFVTLLVILVSVFIERKFSDLITTITKSKASQANPRITETLWMHLRTVILMRKNGR